MSTVSSDAPLREFFNDVGLGAVPGFRRVAALGNNPTMNTGADEDVWTGSSLYPFKSAAGAMEIISASVNDAAAGTGARTVLVNGLDANYVEQSETVTLNGTTAVALTKSYLRINSALINSAGSGETNAGNINVRDSGAGTTRAIVPAGYGITRQSVFTVPAGYTLSELSTFASINRTGGGAVRYATFATFVRSSNGFYRMPLEFSVSSNTPYRHDGNPGIILAEKTDFAIRCTNVTVDNSDVTAAWLGVMRAN